MNTNSIDAFKKLREQLNSLIVQIEDLIKRLAFQEAEKKLQDINEVYERLGELSKPDSPTQQKVLLIRSIRIQALESQIQAGLERREIGKRGDGNIAFKCNWNDAGYKGICSDPVYNVNKRTPRSQCSRSNCRDYVGKFPPENDCCYECQALRNDSFGAGWDHDEIGKLLRPRHIWDARKGKVAFLTTIPHWSTERLVVGAYIIREVKDDPYQETFLLGDADTALDDMLGYGISFWQYHKNPYKPESQAWGQGLFRYVSDIAALGILEAYRASTVIQNGDASKVDRILESLKQTHTD